MVKTLNETAPMMESSDYKERFRAEYYQLDIRINKLESMLQALYNNKLDFQPTCPAELLQAQLDSMKVYRHFLIERAKIESVNL